MLYTGIAASPGIAMGKAYIYKEDKLSIDKSTISPQLIPEEIAKVREAIVKTKKQLESLKDKSAVNFNEERAEIFAAHLLVLDDTAFLKEIEEHIFQERIGAGYAVQKVIDKYLSFFSEIDDSYLKERSTDIRDIGNRLTANILGIDSDRLKSLKEKAVVIAHDLTPSDTASMDKKNVLGFAINVGSKTSHTSIMARSLDIPAIAGLGDITAKIRENDYVILDGFKGILFVNPDQEQINIYREKLKENEVAKEKLQELRTLPTITKDGHKIEIAANIGTPEELNTVKANGAEGIGLYRTEFIFMNRTDLPSEEEQFLSYKKVAEGLNGRTVIIRTLDVGGDKNIPYLEIPRETNPFLGWRAIRYCLDREDLFAIQLRAMLRASAFGKVQIMYPMITSLDEILRANAILERVKKTLTGAGIEYNREIKVGIMVETPAAAVTADMLIKHVDFFSIGTNDLCQYTLAVDRMNERINKLYQPMHPAILQLIKKVIDASRSENKMTGICGEMAGEPLGAIILLGLGVDELSMSPSVILKIKKLLRSISYQEAKEGAETALTLPTAEEVVKYCKKRWGKLLERED